MSLLFKVIGAVILTVLWIWREWSWHSYRAESSEKLVACTEILNEVRLRLSIEERAQFKCENTNLSNRSIPLNFTNSSLEILDDMPYCTHDIGAFVASQGKVEAKQFVPPPVLNDRITLLQILFSCCLILYEYNYIHDLNNDNYESKNTILDSSVQRRLKEFLIRRFPVTSTLFFTSIIVVSSLAWLGLIDRSFFVRSTIKIVINWTFAGPLSFTINSFWRLRKYFPELKDKEAWLRSLKDVKWWIWLLSRLIGVYDLPSGTEMVLWMASLVWYVWPLRYFYFYSESGCQVDSHANNDVFLVNALMHNSFSIVCSYILYLLAVIPAVETPTDQSASDSSATDTDTGSIDTSTGVLNAGKDKDLNQYTKNALGYYSYLRSWLRCVDTMSRVATICLLSLSSSLLCFVRLLWFFWFGGCTWYGSLVAWMLLHLQLGIFLSTLPCVNALVDKYGLVTSHKEAFMDKMMSALAEEKTKDMQEKERQKEKKRKMEEIRELEESIRKMEKEQEKEKQRERERKKERNAGKSVTSGKRGFSTETGADITDADIDGTQQQSSISPSTADDCSPPTEEELLRQDEQEWQEAERLCREETSLLFDSTAEHAVVQQIFAQRTTKRNGGEEGDGAGAAKEEDDDVAKMADIFVALLQTRMFATNGSPGGFPGSGTSTGTGTGTTNTTGIPDPTGAGSGMGGTSARRRTFSRDKTL